MRDPFPPGVLTTDGGAATRPDGVHLLPAAVGRAILGKPDTIRHAVVSLLAGGHLLIEDVPGVGKTSLARALARAIGGSFRRVQFTSDLLPADILGVNVLDSGEKTFLFRPGPIFCHVLLADEINRTTPRTQSALLQAMEENRVTLDGVTHALPEPFFVIATQNPLEHHGTYPLPESQMDRFLMRLSMGYPDRGAERALLRGPSDPSEDGPPAALSPEALEPVLNPASLAAARRAAQSVRCAPDLIDYLLAVVEATRRSPDLALGASPRASLALVAAARAAAYLEGRAFVLPDDIKSLAEPILAHRLIPKDGLDAASRRDAANAILADLIEKIPVPL